MRTTAAIFFLILFLFNHIGYKYWFYYLEQKETASFEATLDEQAYDEKDCITLKVPLCNPYLSDRNDFERVDGEITIHNIIYKYVKRKVQNGQLILLCLPHYKKMGLAKAVTEFGSHAGDPITSGKKNSSNTIVKSELPNEYQANASWQISDQLHLADKQYPGYILSPLASSFIAFPGKPPRLG